MKWWYWLLVSAFITLCVIFVAQFGMGPKPIRMMNPTEFGNGEQIGAVLYRRLYAPIKKAKIVIMGVQTESPSQAQIPFGFMKTAASQDLKFDHVFVDTELGKYAVGESEPIELRRSAKEVVERFKKLIADNKRILLVTHSYYASGVPYKSLSSYIRENIQTNIFSFASVPVPLERAQEKDLQPGCQTAGEVAHGVGRIGCFILKKSRNLYRKKLYDKGLVAAIDQVGTQDYLIYVSF